MSKIEDFETIEQAAGRYGYSAATVWRWIKAGKLTTYRVFGRKVIKRTDMDAAVAAKGGKVSIFAKHTHYLVSSRD